LNGIAAGVLALVALAAIYGAFAPTQLVSTEPNVELSQFSIFQKRADALGAVSDPIQRDSMCIPLSAFGRSIDAQLPTNARVFLLNMVGPENGGKLGYYYFLTYYLFPREVAISIGETPHYTMTGMMGRAPASVDELVQAGYDLALQEGTDGRWQTQALRPMQQRSPESLPKPFPASDRAIAFILPLAVALAGSRLIRLLFPELQGVLSVGEFLSCGLALCAFLSTQSILGLRLAGVKLEQPLAFAIILWGAVELVLLVLRLRKQPPLIGPAHFWWLLLLPALVMLWPLFRRAGIEGLLEFDAIAFWSFKAKLFHACAGHELWTWLKNPALGYAHLDYPLTASLLHSFTYGAIGHVNEFVTKFWNQWMLALLAWAILGATRFPGKSPWMAASAVTALFLVPVTLDFTLKEGGTIPMAFFAVTSSLQLALGMADKQPARLLLGLLLLMATAMVKFEGMILLALWGALILLDKDSRSAIWPPKRAIWIGLLGFAGWLPYIIFRLQGPILHPESAWMKSMMKNMSDVFHMAPMTVLGFISRRFLNNDFANWTATDNHAVWEGKWTGFTSLVDQSTLGIAWACIAVLIAAWFCGGKLRWTTLRLTLVFFAFGTAIGIVWSSTHTEPLNYAGALSGSAGLNGGRYLYPALMAWFVTSVVLLVRAIPERLTKQVQEKPQNKSAVRKRNK
jgi:hypothetical protein